LCERLTAASIRTTERPLEHQDVTTTISLLGYMQHDIARIRKCWRTSLAKKQKIQKMTPEEIADRERTQQMVRERIAYHEANAHEAEDRKRKASEEA
jgi:hypothetical protein